MDETIGGEMKRRLVLAASQLGCQVEDLLGWREMDDGVLVVLSPIGAKHFFPNPNERSDQTINVSQKIVRRERQR